MAALATELQGRAVLLGRDARLALLASVCLLGSSGCAGGIMGYGPGTNGLQRTSKGVTQTTATEMATNTGHTFREDYESAEMQFGVQLGARVGATWAKLPGESLAMGLAVDAHADLTLAFPKWGVGLAAGYTGDRTAFGDHEWFYSGMPVVVYGQYSLVPRFFLHAGGGRVFLGSVKRIEDDTAPEVSGDANAWRGLAGANWVVSRSASNDFVLRLEGRGTWSGDVQVADRDAAWTSYAVLAEILWVTF
jgi:hypothetical protein